MRFILLEEFSLRPVQELTTRVVFSQLGKAEGKEQIDVFLGFRSPVLEHILPSLPVYPAASQFMHPQHPLAEIAASPAARLTGMTQEIRQILLRTQAALEQPFEQPVARPRQGQHVAVK